EEAAETKEAVETAKDPEPEEAYRPLAKGKAFSGSDMTVWANSISNKATGVVKKLFGKEED
ncbi:MAG: hypothetical protein LUG56_01210, partial [Lachnospiraceae bacterium]|nr:hypothetical protein [Lachnospiraceae bacterium]